MNVLVLEASTSAAKAMVYSEQLGILHLEVLDFPDTLSSGDRQDAEGVLQTLLETGRKAAAGYNISAIALVGTWHSLLLCDKGKPITPIFTWMYTQAEEIARKYRLDAAWTKNFHKKTGCMPHALYPMFKLLYLREQGMDVAQYAIGGGGEYFFRHLTGERVMSFNMASGTGLFNVHTLDWDQEMLDFTGLSRKNLPTLTSMDNRPLLPDAANQLGVSCGIPVITAFADGCMNQLGAGAFKPGIMTMSVGTSCAVRMITPAPAVGTESLGLWCYYAVDSWLTGAATAGGTNCVNWFQKNISGGRSLKELDQLITTGDLPVFLPFLFGERCPGWDASRRGGFLELNGTHTTAQLYSAMLEGILFNVRQCSEQLASLHEVRKINLSGGILYSPAWRQMAADILQRDLHTPASEQASLLGGAGIALLTQKRLGSLAEYGKAENEIIRPRPEMQRYYEQRYQQYLAAYELTSRRGLRG